MHSRMRAILKLLREEKIPYPVLMREIAAFLPTLQKNEEDRAWVQNALWPLHQDWLQKSARFN